MSGRRLGVLVRRRCLARDMPTFLEQYAACEAVVHVPEVDARYAAFKVPGRVSTFLASATRCELTTPCIHRTPHSP